MAKRTHSSIGDVLEPAARRVPRHHDLEDPLPREPGARRSRSARRRGTASSTPADVERLRFILRQQREHFLPLKVIKERLDEIDRERRLRGARRPTAEPAKRAASIRPPSTQPLFEDDAARRAERDEARSVATVARARRRRPRRPRGRRERREPHPRRARTGRRASPTRSSAGSRNTASSRPTHTAARPRAVRRRRARDRAGRARRSCGTASSRGTCACTARSPNAKPSLFEQVLLPYRRQRNPEAQARTRETLGELSGLGRRLRTALLRQTVRRSFN